MIDILPEFNLAPNQITDFLISLQENDEARQVLSNEIKNAIEKHRFELFDQTLIQSRTSTNEPRLDSIGLQFYCQQKETYLNYVKECEKDHSLLGCYSLFLYIQQKKTDIDIYIWDKNPIKNEFKLVCYTSHNSKHVKDVLLEYGDCVKVSMLLKKAVPKVGLFNSAPAIKSFPKSQTQKSQLDNVISKNLEKQKDIETIINYLKRVIKENEEIITPILDNNGLKVPLKAIYIKFRKEHHDNPSEHKRIAEAQQSISENNEVKEQFDYEWEGNRILFSQHLNRKTKKSDPLTIYEIYKDNQCFIVLGDPGSGKTTLTRWLMLKAAHNYLREYNAELKPLPKIAERDIDPNSDSDVSIDFDSHLCCLPLFVSIWDYANYLQDNSSSPWQSSILIYLKNQLAKSKKEALLFEQSLKTGMALIVMDGLDEIPESKLRSDVITNIKQFIKDNQKIHCILTSRIAGNMTFLSELENIPRFYIEEMSSIAIRKFCRLWIQEIAKIKYFNSTEIQELENNFWHQAQKQSDLMQLLTNLQLASLITILFVEKRKLTNQRVELYDEIAKYMTTSWIKRHRLKIKEEDIGSLSEDIFSLLEDVAMKIQESGDAVHLRDLIILIERPQFAAHQIVQNTLIMAIRRDVSLLINKHENKYWFLHRSFQEYFVARYLLKAYNNDFINIFKDKSFDPHWREPLLMALGHLSLHEPDYLLSRLNELLTKQPQSFLLEKQIHSNAALFLSDALADIYQEKLFQNELWQNIVQQLINQLIDIYQLMPPKQGITQLRQYIREILDKFCQRYQYKDQVVDILTKRLNQPNTASPAVELMDRLHLFENKHFPDLLKSLSYDSTIWCWPINRCLRNFVSNFSTDSVNRAYLDFRNELDQNLIGQEILKKDLDWSLVITVLYGGYSFHDMHHIIQDYYQLLAYLCLDASQKEFYLNALKSHWGQDTTTTHMEVYASMLMSKKSIAAKTMATFDISYIYNDSPLTDNIIQFLPNTRHKYSAQAVNKLRLCLEGIIKSTDKKSDLLLRSHALFALMALGSNLDNYLPYVADLKNPLIEQISQLIHRLTDPVCSSTKAIWEKWLKYLMTGKQPIDLSLIVTRCLLSTFMQAGAIPPVSDVHELLSPNLRRLPEQIQIYLLAEYLAYIFTGVDSDKNDELLEKLTLLNDNYSPVLLMHALLKMAQTYQRSKPISSTHWSFIHLPPQIIAIDDIPIALLNLIESMPRKIINIVCRWLHQAILLPQIKRNSNLLPEVVIILMVVPYTAHIRDELLQELFFKLKSIDWREWVEEQAQNKSSPYYQARIFARMAKWSAEASKQKEWLERGYQASDQIKDFYQKAEVLEQLLIVEQLVVDEVSFKKHREELCQIIWKIQDETMRIQFLTRLVFFYDRPDERKALLMKTCGTAIKITDPVLRVETLQLLEPIYVVYPDICEFVQGKTKIIKEQWLIDYHNKKYGKILRSELVKLQFEDISILSPVILIAYLYETQQKLTSTINCSLFPWLLLKDNDWISKYSEVLIERGEQQHLIFDSTAALVLDELLNKLGSNDFSKKNPELLKILFLSVQATHETTPLLQRWMLLSPILEVQQLAALLLAEQTQLHSKSIPLVVPLLYFYDDKIRFRTARVVHHPSIISKDIPTRLVSVFGIHNLVYLRQIITKLTKTHPAAALRISWLNSDLIWDDIKAIDYLINQANDSEAADVLENIEYVTEPVYEYILSILKRKSDNGRVAEALMLVICGLIEQNRMSVIRWEKFAAIKNTIYNNFSSNSRFYLNCSYEDFVKKVLQLMHSFEDISSDSPEKIFKTLYPALITNCCTDFKTILSLPADQIRTSLQQIAKAECYVEEDKVIESWRQAGQLIIKAQNPRLFIILIKVLIGAINNDKQDSDGPEICYSLLMMAMGVFHHLPITFMLSTESSNSDSTARQVFLKKEEIDDLEHALVKAATYHRSYPGRAAALLLLGRFGSIQMNVIEAIRQSVLDVKLVSDCAFEAATNLHRLKTSNYLNELEHALKLPQQSTLGRSILLKLFSSLATHSGASPSIQCDILQILAHAVDLLSVIKKDRLHFYAVEIQVPHLSYLIQHYYDTILSVRNFILQKPKLPLSIRLIDMLNRNLRTSAPVVYQTVLDGLKKLNQFTDPATVKRLLSNALDTQSDICLATINTLGALIEDDVEIIQTLINFLGEPDLKINQASGNALVQLSSEECLKQLRKVLQGDNERIRVLSARILIMKGVIDEQVITTFIAAINRSSLDIQFFAVSGLMQLEEDDLESSLQIRLKVIKQEKEKLENILIWGLGHSFREIRAEAALGINQLNSLNTKMQDTFIIGLTDDDSEYRSMCYAQLQFICSKHPNIASQLLKAYINCLNASNPKVRQDALEWLQNYDLLPKTTYPLLIHCLTDSDAKVVMQATQLIAERLSEFEMIEVLIDKVNIFKDIRIHILWLLLQVNPQIIQDRSFKISLPECLKDPNLKIASYTALVYCHFAPQNSKVNEIYGAKTANIILDLLLKIAAQNVTFDDKLKIKAIFYLARSRNDQQIDYTLICKWLMDIALHHFDFELRKEAISCFMVIQQLKIITPILAKYLIEIESALFTVVLDVIEQHHLQSHRDIIDSLTDVLQGNESAKQFIIIQRISKWDLIPEEFYQLILNMFNLDNIELIAAISELFILLDLASQVEILPWCQVYLKHVDPTIRFHIADLLGHQRNQIEIAVGTLCVLLEDSDVNVIDHTIRALINLQQLNNPLVMKKIEKTLANGSDDAKIVILILLTMNLKFDVSLIDSSLVRCIIALTQSDNALLAILADSATQIFQKAFPDLLRSLSDEYLNESDYKQQLIGVKVLQKSDAILPETIHKLSQLIGIAQQTELRREAIRCLQKYSYLREVQESLTSIIEHHSNDVEVLTVAAIALADQLATMNEKMVNHIEMQLNTAFGLSTDLDPALKLLAALQLAKIKQKETPKQVIDFLIEQFPLLDADSQMLVLKRLFWLDNEIIDNKALSVIINALVDPNKLIRMMSQLILRSWDKFSTIEVQSFCLQHLHHTTFEIKKFIWNCLRSQHTLEEDTINKLKNEFSDADLLDKLGILGILATQKQQLMDVNIENMVLQDGLQHESGIIRLQAIKILQQKISLDESFIPILKSLANNDDINKVSNIAKKLLSEHNKALHRRSQQQKNDDLSQLQLAQKYVSSGQYGKSIPILTELIKKNPQNTDILSLIILAYENQHDYERALIWCYKLVVFNPEFYDYIGLLEAKQGNLEKSKDAFLRYIERFPNDISGYTNLACCFHIEGNIEAAKEKFITAIALSNESNVLCEYGHFLYMNKDFAGAVEQLERAVEQLERAVDGQREIASLTFSELEGPIIDEVLREEIEKTGQPIESIKAAFLSYYLLVKCYVMLENKDKAERAYLKLQKLVNNSPDKLQQKMLQEAGRYLTMTPDEKIAAKKPVIRHYNSERQIIKHLSEYYSLLEAQLRQMKNPVLPDFYCNTDQLIQYICLHCRELSHVTIADIVWQIKLTTQASTNLVEQVDFSRSIYIYFLNNFLAISEKTDYVLPVLVEDRYYSVFLIRKSKNSQVIFEVNYIFLDSQAMTLIKYKEMVLSIFERVFDECIVQLIKQLQGHSDEICFDESRYVELSPIVMGGIKDWIKLYYSPQKTIFHLDEPLIYPCILETNSGFIIAKLVVDKLQNRPLFNIDIYNKASLKIYAHKIAEVMQDLFVLLIPRDERVKSIKQQYARRLVNALTAPKQISDALCSFLEDNNNLTMPRLFIMTETLAMILKNHKTLESLEAGSPSEKIFNYLVNLKGFEVLSLIDVKIFCEYMLEPVYLKEGRIVYRLATRWQPQSLKKSHPADTVAVQEPSISKKNTTEEGELNSASFTLRPSEVSNNLLPKTTTKHEIPKTAKKEEVAIAAVSNADLIKQHYELVSQFLKLKKSFALPTAWCDENYLMNYLKNKLINYHQVYLPESCWNVDADETMRKAFFENIQFPLLEFIQFLCEKDKLLFIVPLSAGKHFRGLVIKKIEKNNKIECLYFNPSTECTGPKKDKKLTSIESSLQKAINDLYSKLLHHNLDQPYISYTDDIDIEKLSIKNDKDLERGRLEAAVVKQLISQWRDLPNLISFIDISCGQQITGYDCAFIVAQSLIDLVEGKEPPSWTIQRHDNTGSASAKAIAQVRLDFVDEKIMNKDLIANNLRLQYQEHLENALIMNIEYSEPLKKYILNTNEAAFNAELFKLVHAAVTTDCKLNLSQIPIENLQEFCNQLLEPYFQEFGDPIFGLKQCLSNNNTLIFGENAPGINDEIAHKIFKWLDVKTLVSIVPRVSKNWRRIAERMQEPTNSSATAIDSSVVSANNSANNSLPTLIFTIANYIPIDPLVYLLQKYVVISGEAAEIFAIQRNDIDDWLRNDSSKTHVVTLLFEKIANLFIGQKLFIPINIKNEHFTLLAIMKNSQNKLLAIYVDSNGDYMKTSKLVHGLFNDFETNIGFTFLTEKYQDNNDCAIQVYEAVKILLLATEEQFGSEWLWSEIKRLNLDRAAVGTEKRLAFANEVLKEKEHFSIIYSDVKIDEALSNNALRGPFSTEDDIELTAALYESLQEHEIKATKEKQAASESHKGLLTPNELKGTLALSLGKTEVGRLSSPQSSSDEQRQIQRNHEELMKKQEVEKRLAAATDDSHEWLPGMDASLSSDEEGAENLEGEESNALSM